MAAVFTVVSVTNYHTNNATGVGKKKKKKEKNPSALLKRLKNAAQSCLEINEIDTAMLCYLEWSIMFYRRAENSSRFWSS